MAQYEATQGQRHLVFWRDKLDEPQFVYVIRAAEGGPIKVGIAKSPERRLASLQTGNPSLLRIIHCIPGDRQLEAAFHMRLDKSRMLGEWFDGPDVPEFLEHIESLATRMVDHYTDHGIAPGITEHTPASETDDQRELREWRWRRIGQLWIAGWGKERIRADVRRSAEKFETDILRMRAEAGYELDEKLVWEPPRGYTLASKRFPEGTYRAGLVPPPPRKLKPAPVTVRFAKPDPRPIPLTPREAKTAATLDISHDEWRRRGLSKAA